MSFPHRIFVTFLRENVPKSCKMIPGRLREEYVTTYQFTDYFDVRGVEACKKGLTAPCDPSLLGLNVGGRHSIYPRNHSLIKT